MGRGQRITVGSLSFHLMGLRDQTQAVMSHFTDPKFACSFFFLLSLRVLRRVRDF